jgi:hypothetical protein
MVAAVGEMRGDPDPLVDRVFRIVEPGVEETWLSANARQDLRHEFHANTRVRLLRMYLLLAIDLAGEVGLGDHHPDEEGVDLTRFYPPGKRTDAAGA